MTDLTLTNLLHHELELRWLVPDLDHLEAEDIAVHPYRTWIIDALLTTLMEYSVGMDQNFRSFNMMLTEAEDLYEENQELERLCQEWADDTPPQVIPVGLDPYGVCVVPCELSSPCEWSAE